MQLSILIFYFFPYAWFKSVASKDAGYLAKAPGEGMETTSFNHLMGLSNIAVCETNYKQIGTERKIFTLIY